MRYWTVIFDKKGMPESLIENQKKLLDLIKKRKAAEAEKTARKHIIRGKRLLLNYGGIHRKGKGAMKDYGFAGFEEAANTEG